MKMLTNCKTVNDWLLHRHPVAVTDVIASYLVKKNRHT